MKSFLLFVLALPLFSVAAPMTQTSISSEKSYHTVEFYDVEAQIFATSISPSMSLGPSLSYQMDSENKIGFRALVPLQRSNDIAALSLSGFYRHIYSPKQTSFFSEFGLSHNIFGRSNVYANDSALSAEANVGLTHRFNPEFGIGGLAGLSLAQADVKQTSVETHSSEFFLYPRLAVFGSFEF